MNHGFVRAPDGRITTFDAPGAGTGSGQGTVPSSVDCLNQAGEITGFYFDASSAVHGFVRATDGDITTFDVPGAGTGSGQGTYGYGINLAGMIEGTYVDSNGVYHGYVRTRDRDITPFDVLGAAPAAARAPRAITSMPPGRLRGHTPTRIM